MRLPEIILLISLMVIIIVQVTYPYQEKNLMCEQQTGITGSYYSKISPPFIETTYNCCWTQLSMEEGYWAKERRCKGFTK